MMDIENFRETILMKKNADTILMCALIGLCFLWTGSGYLTWLYHLLSFYPASSVDIYTEIIGYIFQMCGLILFSFCMKKSISRLPQLMLRYPLCLQILFLLFYLFFLQMEHVHYSSDT